MFVCVERRRGLGSGMVTLFPGELTDVHTRSVWIPMWKVQWTYSTIVDNFPATANNRDGRRPKQNFVVSIFFAYRRLPVRTNLISPIVNQSKNVLLFFRMVIEAKINEFAFV